VNQIDGTIDYSKYAQEDLKSCLASIDREISPKNFAALKAEIENRKRSGHWDEKESEFQDILGTQRGIWILICVAYLPAWGGSRLAYQYLAGQEMPVGFQAAFLGIYFSIALAVRWKMGQMRCPNCGERIGGFQINSIITYGKCPHCGYQGVK
jgi:predicted RNA-binding Zn-ribbon protein involved in translation (DUF1610 family)